MIFKGLDESGQPRQLDNFNIGEIPLVAIYRGTRLIWEAVRSCFGSGRWVQAKPWIGNETWKY